MKKKLFFIFISFPFGLNAQITTQTISTTGDGTFSIPCGVTSIEVEVWGGGGGGGDATSNYALAGGGSGGAYAKKTISVTPGSTFNYFVATGGNSGTNGGDSWFNSPTTLKALGGIGAASCTSGFGIGATAVTNGNVGGSLNSYASAGGNAGSVFINFSGTGSNGGGAGGLGGARLYDFSGILSASDGNNGAQPGGGGGGAYTNDGALKNGGKGGNGLLKLTYTLPKPTVDAGSNVTKNCATIPTIGVVSVPGVTYSWSPIIGLTNPNSASTKANPSVTTTYTLTATDACGYFNTDSVKVTVTATQSPPTIGTIVQPTCTTATGSINLSDLPPSGTWTLTPYLNGIAQTAITGSGSTKTITGLVFGSYVFMVRNSTNCTSGFSSLATINAQPIQTTPSVGIITQPTCAVASGSVILSGLPSLEDWTLTPYLNGIAQTGITDSGTSKTIVNLTAGTYTFTVTNISDCTSVASLNVVIHTQPTTPTEPKVSTVTGTSCSNSTGSIKLIGLPSGPWTLTQNPDMVSINGSGTSTAISNLPIGSYTFTVTDGNCTSGISNPAVIVDDSSTTWDGNTWSNLSPDLTKIALIEGDYNMNFLENMEACNIIIKSPAKITVAANTFLTIQNDLTVDTGATLEVENQGSLVMISDTGRVINNGTTAIRKTTTPYEKYDYTYWSAPVATSIGNTLSTWRQDYSFEFKTANFSDLNGDSQDDNQDAWVRVSQTTAMEAGKGYAIMAPTTGTFPTTKSILFSGKVNNGVITQNGVLSANHNSIDDDYNLLGNPYPSAISADAFITANPNVQGTIYLWTHVGDLSISNLGPGLYNYSTDDYAMYNFTGGVGVGVPANNALSSNDKPTGYIASGQGFFVGVYDTSPIVFNNTMRSKFFDNTNFYRATREAEKDRVWLNLKNKDGMFSQQLIGYFDNATLGFDRGYDGIVSPTTNYISFYSILNRDQYRIQGRPAFNEKDVVPLGYSSALADTFTIAVDTKEGQLNSRFTAIYIEDKLLNVIHDLNQSPYSFKTEKGTFNDRFVLRYLNPALGISDIEAIANNVTVAVNGSQIQVKSNPFIIKDLAIYTVLGKVIADYKNINNNELNIPNKATNPQFLLIKITLSNGQSVIRKMTY